MPKSLMVCRTACSEFGLFKDAVFSGLAYALFGKRRLVFRLTTVVLTNFRVASSTQIFTQRVGAEILFSR